MLLRHFLNTHKRILNFKKKEGFDGKMSDDKNMIKELQHENEEFKHKMGFLEQSLKGALKENTVLRVDINVLQSQIKEHKKSSEIEKTANIEVLETQLNFKTQECDALQKKLDEALQIQTELENQIHKMAKTERKLKDLENQIKAQTLVITSLQDENEMLKKISKNLSISTQETSLQDAKKTSAKKKTTSKK
jgi:predicted RNase H-like nuclease (RuvC/YqgF family)